MGRCSVIGNIGEHAARRAPERDVVLALSHRAAVRLEEIIFLDEELRAAPSIAVALPRARELFRPALLRTTLLDDLHEWTLLSDRWLGIEALAPPSHVSAAASKCDPSLR